MPIGKFCAVFIKLKNNLLLGAEDGRGGRVRGEVQGRDPQLPDRPSLQDQSNN